VALAGDAAELPTPLDVFSADLERILGWRLAAVASPGADALEIPPFLRKSMVTASGVPELLEVEAPDLLIVAGKDPLLLARVREQTPRPIGVVDLPAVMSLLERGPGGARERPSRLLDRLPDPIFVVDSTCTIRVANRAFLELFPDAPAPISANTCHQVLYARAEPCARSDCPLRTEVGARGAIRYRDYRLSAEGVDRRFEAAFNPIGDGPNGPDRFLVSMRDVSARVALEDELERSRSRYLQLFEHAREGICLFDASGRILETNTSLSLLLGHLQGDLISMKVPDLAEGASAEILARHLEDLQTLGSVTVEMVFSRKHGRSIPVEADIVWLSEERIFLLMARDMTARKRLEASRRLYSEKLKTEVEERTRELQTSQLETVLQKQYAEGIIQGTPVPMLVLDRHHRITFWNKACEALTGYTSEEMIGTDRQWEPFYPEPRPTMADLILEDDPAAIERLHATAGLRRLPLIEGAWEAESYFPHIGPEGAHIYCTAAPIRDESGAIQGAIVTYQDVSGRVNMTREIERREAFVQNLIHNSIDGIIATNPEGTIVIFNRGASRILGYDPGEVLGRLSYQDILSRQTDRDVVGSFYGERFGPPGKLLNMESELLNREGEAIPVRLSGALLYEEGEEVGSVVFVQDLREIQRLQKEKAGAERMAAIGRTVAGLAHYIKNVLNGLKGGGYVVQSGLRQEDIPLTARGWSMVERNLDQISNIVMDMLIYSTDRRPRYEAVDPNDLAAEVLELMTERAKLANVRLESDLAADSGPVPMDRTGIHRALLNLVSNAIDACTLEGIVEGNGRVHLRVDRPAGWGVRFTVSDNGTGIDEPTQERLFSDFFTTKGYKGTGLGLPVTQKIVHEHGGRLGFESEPGRGSVFTILLPGDRNPPSGKDRASG
jgi:PAS domain S-box-containing protein